ncbi:hypothetical protein HQ535_01745 [bacterium]|nr:hypothetical protein [bacterium]
MGQQPSIPVDIGTAPRRSPQPATARSWTPTRPGELSGPDVIPWGGAFGTPGPDAGYALKVLAGRDLDLADGEHRHDVEVGLAAIMTARASRFGRAPMVEDAETAELLLGLTHEGVPAAAVDALTAMRRRVVPGIGHAPSRLSDLIAGIDVDVLEGGPEAVRRALTGGDLPIGA